MGSFRGNHEIQEANDELAAARRKPPMLKKGYNKTLEDDINKLFESVNLRTCKSLDLSDSRRNPSKKPMRSNGAHSPGIGFSEPVSLKQALRGLCISQAAEMAALKRSSMPPSPRISEVGRISNKYRSVVVETGECGTSVFEGGERRIEISLVPEENAASSSKLSPSIGVDPIIKNLESGSSRVEVPLVREENTASSSVRMSVTTGDSNSSPCFDDNPVIKNSDHSHVVKCEDELTGEDNKVPKQEKKFFGSNKVANMPSKDSATCMKVVDKPAPKVRRKSRLQNVSSSSSVVKGKKDVNLPKSTSRAVKPVIRNKNVVIKKPKKVVVLSSNGNSQTSDEVNSDARLICQKCQCSLTDTIKEDTSVVKTTITCKGDISQSSKDSICDFSSSTNTSLSDDSNLSGSSCGNRPHMSKDMRWGAINHVRKQHGFLGLNHFNLLKKLGSGDIGTVYLAELVGTHCPFAIKVMDNEFLAGRKKMARAQTEREILRMLDHPFLPTLYAQFTSNNLSCLVMEFCPGGDLHVLRQKQPGRYFPEQAARFYVAEVLLALEYLHMLGIVYRDLKPENILVREDGHIMLTDFDLSLRCSVNPTLVTSSTSAAMDPARMSGPCAGSNCIDPFCTGPACKMSCFSPHFFPTSRRLKAEALAAQARSLPQLVAEPTDARSNSFVGTHEYLAPEIIKGEGHGSAVDWWTLGVFLYELLYGKTPFKGAGNEETLANVVLQNLKFPDSPIVSFQARDLIRGLLVKEPENRLGTETGAAEIKRHPFFEGLNWALIRCAVPPQVPEFYAVGNLGIGNGEHLEFELF